MFEGIFKKGADKAQEVAGAESLSEEIIAQAQEMVRDTVLEGDEYTKKMFENGFTAPDGTKLNPIEFLAQRKSLLEAGEAGASVAESTPAPTAVAADESRKMTDIGA